MFQELLQVLKQPSAWLYMGWYDVVMRYRRTFLGPFWSVLTTAIFVTMMGFVSATLFKEDLSHFFPYLTTGILTWTFLNHIIIETTSLFEVNAGSVANLPNSPLVYILRMFVKLSILFGHNLLIFVAVALYFQTGFQMSWLWLPLSFGVYFLTTISLGILLGFVCTRFRDVMQLVISLMSVVVFVTPVMWRPEMLGDRGWVAAYNPLYHYVELFRAPLLGYELLPQTLWAVAGTTTLMFVGACFVFSRYRYRLAYWV